jgi:hypothetical protein
MATTFQTIIDDAQRTFNDMPDATALTLVRDIDRRVLQHIPLYKATEDITLVAGTREYALNEATVRVWHAEYLEASNSDPEAMQAVQVEWLNQNVSGWRSTSRGRPREYYTDYNLSDLLIGFNPLPETSTSGGYPTVRCYVSRIRLAAQLTDTVPKGLTSDEVYKTGIRWLWAQETRLEEAEYWRGLYEKHLADEARHYADRLVQAPRSITPSWMPRGRGVV